MWEFIDSREAVGIVARARKLGMPASDAAHYLIMRAVIRWAQVEGNPNPHPDPNPNPHPNPNPNPNAGGGELPRRHHRDGRLPARDDRDPQGEEEQPGEERLARSDAAADRRVRWWRQVDAVQLVEFASVGCELAHCEWSDFSARTLAARLLTFKFARKRPCLTSPQHTLE